MVEADDPRVIAAIEMKRQDGRIGVMAISRAVGLNKSVVARALREAGLWRKGYSHRNSLNRVVVLAFIDARAHDEPIEGYRQTRLYIGGVEPSETQMRRLHAWRNDPSAEPSIWGLDSFLTGPPNLGHIEEFFDFCEREGLKPWSNGRPDWSPT